jgi:hypothetical protein
MKLVNVNTLYFARAMVSGSTMPRSKFLTRRREVKECSEGSMPLYGSAQGFNPGKPSPQGIRPERARDDYMVKATLWRRMNLTSVALFSFHGQGGFRSYQCGASNSPNDLRNPRPQIGH